MGNVCCQHSSEKASEVTNVNALTEAQQLAKEEPAQEPVQMEALKEPEKEESTEASDEAPIKEEVALPSTAKEEEPTAKFEIVFLTSENAEKTLNFTKRPLGMKFNNVLPISITRVEPGGHAEELGVQAGWQINKVGGKSITDSEYKDYELLKACFFDKTAMLPFEK